MRIQISRWSSPAFSSLEIQTKPWAVLHGWFVTKRFVSQSYDDDNNNNNIIHGVRIRVCPRSHVKNDKKTTTLPFSVHDVPCNNDNNDIRINHQWPSIDVDY